MTRRRPRRIRSRAQFTGHGLANMYLGVAELHDAVPPALVLLPPPGIRALLPGQLESHAAADPESRPALRVSDADLRSREHAAQLRPREARLRARHRLRPFVQARRHAALDRHALREFGGNIITLQRTPDCRRLWFTKLEEFGPRLGFAYRAFDGEVVRGSRRLPHLLLPATDVSCGSAPRKPRRPWWRPTSRTA